MSNDSEQRLGERQQPLPEDLVAKSFAQLDALEAARPEFRLRRELSEVEIPEATLMASLHRATLHRFNRRLSSRKSRRASWGPWVTTATVAALLGGGLWFSERVPNAAEAVGGAAQLSLSINRFEGDVSLVRNGRSVTLRQGDTLRDGDELATGGFSKAWLSTGATSPARVVLDGHSRLRVRGTAENAVVLDVLGGRAEAEAGLTTLSFALNSRSIRLLQGRIGLVRSQGSRLVLAALHPSRLRAEGRTIELPQRSVLTLARGAGPVVTNAPSDPAVSARQLEPLTPGARSVTITGYTGIDVVLVVGHEPIDVADDGKYSADIPVEEDAKSILVVAKNVLGESKSVELPLVWTRVSSQWGEPG